MRHQKSSSMSSVQVTFCTDLTKKIIAYPIARFFREPVDPGRDGAPDYHEKVKKPMDLGTVLQNLQDEKYPSVDKWRDDMNLVWKNAMTYNGPGTPLFAIAKDLSEIFRVKSEFVPSTSAEHWLLKLRSREEKITRLLQAKPDAKPISPTQIGRAHV
jgi:hypothetical protein